MDGRLRPKPMASSAGPISPFTAKGRMRMFSIPRNEPMFFISRMVETLALVSARCRRAKERSTGTAISPSPGTQSSSLRPQPDMVAAPRIRIKMCLKDVRIKSYSGIPNQLPPMMVSPKSTPSDQDRSTEIPIVIELERRSGVVR